MTVFSPILIHEFNYISEVLSEKATYLACQVETGVHHISSGDGVVVNFATS